SCACPDAKAAELLCCWNIRDFAPLTTSCCCARRRANTWMASELGGHSFKTPLKSSGNRWSRNSVVLRANGSAGRADARPNPPPIHRPPLEQCVSTTYLSVLAVTLKIRSRKLPSPRRPCASSQLATPYNPHRFTAAAP